MREEKALDNLDKLEKERKIKEFHQNKKYLEYIMNQKKEAEAWMDKIAQDEADRDYKKKQEQWMKEEAKRIELLKQVYKEREKSVMYKKNLREEEKKQIAKERDILDNEILQYNKKIEEINREAAQRRKEHQNELLYQISEKENQKLKELQDAMIAAMKAKDKFRKDAISALVSAVKKKGIDNGCRDNIPDEMANEAILKEIKSVKEQIDTCPADRTELLEEYKKRYEIMSEFAPKMLSAEEVKAILEEKFADVLATKNKGQIMKAVMGELKGKADGKVINGVVAELIK